MAFRRGIGFPTMAQYLVLNMRAAGRAIRALPHEGGCLFND